MRQIERERLAGDRYDEAGRIANQRDKLHAKGLLTDAARAAMSKRSAHEVTRALAILRGDRDPGPLRRGGP